MENYKVKTRIKHDGEVYEPGSSIKMTEDQAKPLITDGVLENPNAPKEEVEPEQTDPGKENPTQTDPGDGKNEDADAPKENKSEESQDNKEKTDNDGQGSEIVKKQYRVIRGVEFPHGTPHKEGSLIDLTDEEAAKFAEGLIEAVEKKSDDGEGL